MPQTADRFQGWKNGNITLTILVPSKFEPNIVKTMMRIEQFFPDAQIITANDRYGKGKGWCVRHALTEATGDIIVFIDGDGEIDPYQICRLLPFITDYDIVIGRKQVRGPLSRRILTRLSRFYILLLFGLLIDTQTGIKMFRRDALPEWKTDGFMFDVEILWKAKRAGRKIIEIPVDVNLSRKMAWKSIWNCLKESWAMMLRQ